MNDLTRRMRLLAADILNKGEAELVLGWEKGSFWYLSPPAFFDSVDDLKDLIWDDYCHHNLSKYLIELKYQKGKIAIFLKACDARALNRLLQDRQIERERLVLIGIACLGLKDQKQAKMLGSGADIPLAEKCAECRYPASLDYDYFLNQQGFSTKKENIQNDYRKIEAIEALCADEKYNFWTKHYDRCLRCYACRNICPACSCLECVFDQAKVGWIGKANNSSENLYFALTRAMHVAGRCIECGECERVCPVGIPIMLINKKINKDINELFGPFHAGLDPDDALPLGHFQKNDPEEFI